MMRLRRCRVGSIGFSGGAASDWPRRDVGCGLDIELHGSTNGRQPILHGG